MRIGQFIAFYPSRPFWAIKEINVNDPKSLEKFEDLMAEEVFEESNETFAITIFRDGMIMLRVEALEKHASPVSADAIIERTAKKWGEYLDYLNSFYLLLDSATIKTMNLAYFNLHEITNRDAFRVKYENGKLAGHNIAIESFTSTFQMGRFKSDYRLPISADTRIFMRRVVSSEAILNAVEQFKLLLKSPGVEKVLASFTKSIAEYKVGNFDTAIILAWFILESIILKIWKDHLSSLNMDAGLERKRVNAERLKFLTGRDFPVSSVSNILELFGRIAFDLFKDLDAVRRFRNNIVHQDPKYSASSADARLAINTAHKLFVRERGIDFALNLSYSLSGI